MQTKSEQTSRGPLLVVEDDPLLLDLLEELITGSGRKVFTAAHGEEAVNIINRQPDIGAVITDLAMPEMDGIRLIRWLSREVPDLPILVLTATSEDGVESLLKERRVDAVIQKPLTGQRIHQLMETLNSLHV